MEYEEDVRLDLGAPSETLGEPTICSAISTIRKQIPLFSSFMEGHFLEKETLQSGEQSREPMKTVQDLG